MRTLQNKTNDFPPAIIKDNEATDNQLETHMKRTALQLEVLREMVGRKPEALLLIESLDRDLRQLKHEHQKKELYDEVHTSAQMDNEVQELDLRMFLIEVRDKLGSSVVIDPTLKRTIAYVNVSLFKRTFGYFLRSYFTKYRSGRILFTYEKGEDTVTLKLSTIPGISFEDTGLRSDLQLLNKVLRADGGKLETDKGFVHLTFRAESIALHQMARRSA